MASEASSPNLVFPPLPIVKAGPLDSFGTLEFILIHPPFSRGYLSFIKVGKSPSQSSKIVQNGEHLHICPGKRSALVESALHQMCLPYVPFAYPVRFNYPAPTMSHSVLRCLSSIPYFLRAMMK
jgi:hypothetical protein